MDNNEGLSKKKHPYAELFIFSFFMLAVPFVVYILLSAAMKLMTKYPPALISCQSEAFAGLIGTAFAGMLLFSDVFSNPFMIVVERVAEFFDNIRYGLWGVAKDTYIHDIKENGINFWIYLALSGFEVFLIVDGLKKFFRIAGLS